MNGAEYSSPPPERQLAAVPPSRFVAERERLAAALARAGDKAGAAALKKLKKPSRALWVLNQLGRDEAAACEELFATSDALSSVQRSAGGDVAAFREAVARQRRQFEALTERARALLVAAGEAGDEATLAKVTRGLRAAAVSGTIREALRGGDLREEPEEPGFFALAGPEVDDGASPEPARAVPGEERDREEARGKARHAEAEARAAEAALQEAEEEEQRARRAHQSASEEVARLRADLETAESHAHALAASLGKRTRAVAGAAAASRAARNRAALLSAKVGLPDDSRRA